jgi:predicted amidohydrolase YtcJ
VLRLRQRYLRSEGIRLLVGLYACVTHELPEGGPKGGWEPQEKISLEDCIRAYTSGSAYAEFEEGRKGELKEGEYADFIILSNDLAKINSAAGDDGAKHSSFHIFRRRNIKKSERD